MSNKISCKQISDKMKTINSKRVDFNIALGRDDVKNSVKLMHELDSLIKEIRDKFWQLEVLTEENIGNQYDGWQEMYQSLDLEYRLPSKERIFEFLKSDAEFMELMKTKEKQGLTKLIVAPAPGFYSLKKLTDQIGRTFARRGYMKNQFFSQLWKDMLSDEERIGYFGAIDGTDPDDPVPFGGVTSKVISLYPDSFGICDGWMISFTTEERNIAKSTEPNQETGGGRKAIETNFNALQYQDLYFSDKNEMYKGEEAMIPQEYLALFAKELYEKLIKVGEAFTESRYMDWTTYTWFISTHLLQWKNPPSARQYKYFDYSPKQQVDTIGVRSVVRRNLKS